MPPRKTSTKKTTKKLASRTPARVSKKLQSVAVVKPLQTQAPKVVVAVKKPVRSFHFGMHVMIAGSAICALLLLGFLERDIFSTNLSSAEDVAPVTIGFEHSAPLSLSVLFAKKENAGYVSITNQSSETIYMNVPSSWTRTEVTGANLVDVTKNIAFFGVSRWTLPGRSGMKLLMPSAPSAVIFDSASVATAAIDLKTIDLTTLGVSNKIVLVQQQTLVPLWGKND